jgi:hypothetical protein
MLCLIVTTTLQAETAENSSPRTVPARPETTDNPPRPTAAITGPDTTADPSQPTATIVGPETAAVGKELTFTARASGEMVEYRWTFGEDEAFSSFVPGRTASHTYSEGGSYLVTCLVRDRKGRMACATKTVTITGGFPDISGLDWASRDQLALVVLIDNDHKNTPWGNIAEWAAKRRIMKKVKRHYGKIYWLVGKRATRQRFFESIRHAARNEKIVDVLLFAHGMSELVAFHGGHVCDGEIYYELFSRGGEAVRMVYQMNCFGASLNDDWLQAGANGVTGPVGYNIFPTIHMPEYLKRWCRGEDMCTAAHKAYRKAKPYGKKWYYKLMIRMFGKRKVRSSSIRESRYQFNGEPVTIFSLVKEPLAKIRPEKKAYPKSEAPIFRIATGSNRYYRVELTPHFYEFSEPRTHSAGVWRSELLPSTRGQALYLVPPAEWARLFDKWTAAKQKKVFYRVSTFRNREEKDRRMSTYSGNVAFAPSIRLKGGKTREKPSGTSSTGVPPGTTAGPPESAGGNAVAGESSGPRRGITESLDRETRKLGR